MSRSKTSILAVLLIAAEVAFPQLANSQDPIPQVMPSLPIPPNYTVVYNCCYNVLCEGADVYVPVKYQSTVSQTDACEKAMNLANYMCSTGVADIYQLPARACKLLPISNVITLQSDTLRSDTLRSNTPSTSENWQIVALLCYCDGTPGVRATLMGANWCDAMKNAREFICEVKSHTHPCKRAFMNFRVAHRPCPTVVCPIRH